MQRLPKFDSVFRSKCIARSFDFNLHSIYPTLQSCSSEAVWPDGIHLWNNQDAFRHHYDSRQHRSARFQPFWSRTLLDLQSTIRIRGAEHHTCRWPYSHHWWYRTISRNVGSHDDVYFRTHWYRDCRDHSCRYVTPSMALTSGY